MHTDSARNTDAGVADGGPDVRTLASSVVYSDPWIRLRKDEIERRDGSRGSYAVVERDDFALIIPAENGGFHLVEEYRYPVGRRSWSFPQGGFPHGESGTPEELAALELAQETGLRAAALTQIGYLTTAHGMSSQCGYYFLATGLVPGTPDREPEEQDMSHAWVPRAEFEQMTLDGRIVDDSTLAAYALLLIAERRGEVRLLPRPADRSLRTRPSDRGLRTVACGPKPADRGGGFTGAGRTGRRPCPPAPARRAR